MIRRSTVSGALRKKKITPDEEEGEPLNKISRFDNMRMFYVALSRAKTGSVKSKRLFYTIFQ